MAKFPSFADTAEADLKEKKLRSLATEVPGPPLEGPSKEALPKVRRKKTSRDNLLTVRFSAEELAMLLDVAEDLNMAPAAMIRHFVMDAVKKRAKKRDALN